MDVNAIQKLVEMFNDSDITELKIKEKDNEIKISRKSTLVAPAATQQQLIAAPPVMPAAAATEAAPAPATSAPAPVEEEGHAVTSPMVGSFYEAPSPTAKPFVQVGDSVKVGDVLCIIEAMKIMNQIQSEVSGKVLKVCVSNGDALEYGQTLFMIG